LKPNEIYYYLLSFY